MLHRIILFLILISAPILALAQPTICAPPPMMQPFCADACIICDIDGFTGINSAGLSGEAPPDFCTSTVHNGRWIGFLAGSTNLTIELQVSNCNSGFGLEMGIYESLDCMNFTKVSNCNGSINNNSTATFTNTVPLVIGQYYYIVMDGNNGDVCNWSFTVVQGSTGVGSLTTSGVAQGPLSICPNLSVRYYTTPQVGATNYQWTLDNVVLGTADSMDIIFPSPGTYNLCITASNVCDTAMPTCTTIVVDTIPATLISANVCNGDTFLLNDTIALFTTGIYNYNFNTAQGCDSVVEIDLIIDPPSQVTVNISICDSDTIYLDSIPYFETGQYVQVLTNAKGCDSTVNLDLNVITCNLQASFTVTDPLCFGASNGSISFFMRNGVPSYDYIWEEFGGTLSGSGNIGLANQTETISGLPAATYLITLTDQASGIRILIADIEDPPLLEGTLVKSDFYGSNVSCFESSDGLLFVIPFGGIPPYAYLWNTGGSTDSIFNLPAGTFSLALSDSNNCLLELSETLIEPEPINFSLEGLNPGCDGPETGVVTVVNTSGGNAPYRFSINVEEPITDTVFSGLGQGTHLIEVLDVNGCSAQGESNLVATVIPVIDLGEDLHIPLGDETILEITSNIPLEKVRWIPADGLSCDTCFDPIAITPGRTTYYAYGISADGCRAVDSITIFTDPRRTVWFPNAFSPDGDGLNEFFNVHGGPEIAVVRSLKIYSRWGELVYDGQNLPPGNEKGWDGTLRGNEAQHGVFSWIAWVDYLDGISLVYTGRVTVIR